MRTIRFLLIGLASGILIGWGLGFLRFPHIEENFSFLIGFITCLALILLTLSLFFVLNRGKEPITPDSKPQTRSSIVIWVFIPILIAAGALVSGYILYRQNAAFKVQKENQDKKIREMSALIESVKKNNLGSLMGKILDDAHEELKNSPDRTLSDSTIARISALNSSFMPYRYFEGDSLLEKAQSPERGQLLLALSLLEMDPNSFAKIKLTTSFSGAYLKGADLQGTDLRWADLHGADLRDANLRNANLSETDLNGASLWGANLNKANLRCAHMKRTDLRWTQLNEANLQFADLSGTNLASAQLQKADLSGATLQWANAEGTLLGDANFTGADLQGTTFEKVNLKDANLSNTDLRKVNLTDANMEGAELTKALVDDNWNEKLKEWRLIGTEIQKRYLAVKDTTDKWKKEWNRLRTIELPAD